MILVLDTWGSQRPPDMTVSLNNDQITMFQILISVCWRFVSNQDLNMRYVAAALLAAQGGQEVSAANIKKILRYSDETN